VKSIRIWLLVLLAVLLPVRGAVAAAMMCPQSTAAEQAETRGTPTTQTQTDHHEFMSATEGHGHDQQTHEEHHSGSSERCNFCCDFCSVTPILSGFPALAPLQELSALSFPALLAPAPSFLSDGQERPPRSI
jgi:hypothetical protein